MFNSHFFGTRFFCVRFWCKVGGVPLFIAVRRPQYGKSGSRRISGY